MESCISFFTPRVMSRRLQIRGDSCYGYQGGVQLMSHYCRAKKKFNLINNLFLKCFKPEKGEWGIFLKFGGKRLFGWV